MSIPTDHYELVELLEGTSAARYNEIRAALLAENPEDPDVEKLFERACDEAIHLANIEAARVNLGEALRQAKLHASYAKTYLSELRGTQDVEYAGRDADILQKYLDELDEKAYMASVLNRHILRFDDPQYTSGGAQ